MLDTDASIPETGNTAANPFLNIKMSIPNYSNLQSYFVCAVVMLFNMVIGCSIQIGG